MAMAQVQPPFPPHSAFIQSIRQSSRSVRCAHNIQIDPGSIKRLLQSSAFTTSFKRVSSSHGLLFPLKFSSNLDELNFLSILSILNFASGYRSQLHAASGRGAWDTIRALVMSLYLASSAGGGDLLSAHGLRSLEPANIAELMGVDLHIEVPHPTILGLTMVKPGGALYDLVGLIAHVLNETGDILVNTGYPNLGAFVVEALKEGESVKESEGPDAALDVVLERLVRAFPAFQDMIQVDGQPVYCFKKALFLIHAVALRFGSVSPPPFPIPSTINSPVFTDNVLPSMLVHLGVINLSQSTIFTSLFPNAGSAEQLNVLLETYKEADNVTVKDEAKVREGPLLTPNQAFVLRAAAIDACELIIEAARNIPLPDDRSLDWVRHITLPELDMWIWAVAKDRRDYRSLERFSLKPTVFF